MRKKEEIQKALTTIEDKLKSLIEKRTLLIKEVMESDMPIVEKFNIWKTLPDKTDYVGLPTKKDCPNLRKLLEKHAYSEKVCKILEYVDDELLPLIETNFPMFLEEKNMILGVMEEMMKYNIGSIKK